MSDKKYDFSGKVVLVTGSSSGIGMATAIKFASYGALLTIHGRNVEALQEVSFKIKEISGQEPLQVIGDMINESTPVKLIQETIDKYGRLDVLVNNAAIGTKQGRLTDEAIMKSYDQLSTINIRSVLHLIHLAWPYLEKTKGNIVNISSIGSKRPLSTVYSLTKAAVDMMTITSAHELGPKGIRVNAINPGPVITGFGRGMGVLDLFEKNGEFFREQTALKRLGTPDDIANLVTFLASPDAENITGDCIKCDGGCLVAKPALEMIE